MSLHYSVTALVFLVAASAAAQAKDPAYVGTWASEPAQCKAGQEMENAPLILKAKGYDQHEAHCKFTSVQKKGAAWAIKARCKVEGDVQRINMTFTVAGDRLTIGDEAGSRTLQRCP